MALQFVILLLAGIAAANAVVAIFAPRDFKSEVILALILLLIAVAIVALGWLPLTRSIR